jgi:hypothetical protein
MSRKNTFAGTAPAPSAFGHVIEVDDPQGTGKRDARLWLARRMGGAAGPSAPLRDPQDSLRLCYANATLPEGTHVQEMYPQFSKGY